MSTTPTRQPAGAPTGGQFAAKSNPECDLDLDLDLDDPDLSIAEMTAERDRLQRRADEITGRISDRYSAAIQQSIESDPEWRSVRVTNRTVQNRLERRGVCPEHFGSDDRDTRMWACSERGDLIFEGELLSNGHQLSRYVGDLDDRRTFHHDLSVDIDGREVGWSALSGAKQMEYIAGYSLAQSDAPSTPPASPYAMAGWLRGIDSHNARVDIEEDANPSAHFTVVDPDAIARHLSVTHVQPVPERGGYEAEVAANQHRWHSTENGRNVVPWAAGARVFFAADAILRQDMPPGR